MLTALMFGTWLVSAVLLPQGLFRPFFSRLFAERVGELTFARILLANLVPFFGVQFMNLFRVRRWAGGLYVLPIFWFLYGLLLGTNSFVFAGKPVPFSLSVLWTRSGFTELLAYEASREWAVWEQPGLWAPPRRIGQGWRPQPQDWMYWGAGAVCLVLGAAREVQ